MSGQVSLSGIQEGRRRRRRFSFLVIVIVIVYCVLLGASWLVLYSPIFRIQQIVIVGNNKVSSNEIEALLKSRVLQHGWRPLKTLLGFRNILIWPDAFSADDLIFLPALKSLLIEKNYKTRSLTVGVEERKAYGIWCFQEPLINADDTSISADGNAKNQRQSASDCWWFDDAGTIFSRAIGAEGSLIVVVRDYSQGNLGLGKNILPERLVPSLFSIFKVLAASGLNIKEIQLNDLALEELDVLIYDGPKLYFSLRFPADNDLPAIQDFAAKPGFGNLQYLDFRVENRVYYK